MRIRILPAASRDLLAGFRFYQKQERGLGHYFLDSLYADIDSLAEVGGVHQKVLGNYHRLVASKFPYAIVYVVQDDVAIIHAVFDCRRNPRRLRRRLR